MSVSTVEKEQVAKLRSFLQNEFHVIEGKEIVLLASLFSHLIQGTEVTKLQQLFNDRMQSNRLALRKLRSVLKILENLGFLNKE